MSVSTNTVVAGSVSQGGGPFPGNTGGLVNVKFGLIDIDGSLSSDDLSGNSFKFSILGDGSGTFGPVSLNSDRSYSSFFTGLKAGSATVQVSFSPQDSLKATIPITIIPGRVCQDCTKINIQTPITSGSPVPVILTLMNSQNNPISNSITPQVSPLDVAAISLTPRVAGGLYPGVISNGKYENGVYTALYTGQNSGTLTLNADLWGEPTGPSVGTQAVVNSAITQIAQGSSANHTCIIKNGIAGCWGSNSNGQLGDSVTYMNGKPPSQRLQATANLYKPIVINGETGATQIAVGQSHTCAIASPSSSLYCWGNNTYGQLGSTPLTDPARNIPVPSRVDLPLPVIQVATGAHHTCAIAGPQFQLYCWGDNSLGQIRMPSTVQQTSVPSLMPNSENIKQVTTGWYHTCAITSGGVLYCWGSNSRGQIGVGTLGGQYNGPQQVNIDGSALSVTAGGSHTCAITNSPYLSSYVYCWGEGALGQLVYSSYISIWQSNDPRLLNFYDGLPSAITAGMDHTCGINNGRFTCWGRSSEYETSFNLGDSFFPGGLPPGGVVTAATAGVSHTCAIVNGGVWCSGSSEFGQAGNGTSGANTFVTMPSNVITY